MGDKPRKIYPIQNRVTPEDAVNNLTRMLKSEPDDILVTHSESEEDFSEDKSDEEKEHSINIAGASTSGGSSNNVIVEETTQRSDKINMYFDLTKVISSNVNVETLNIAGLRRKHSGPLELPLKKTKKQQNEVVVNNVADDVYEEVRDEDDNLLHKFCFL